MPHQTELVATIAIGLSAAFAGGMLARRLRLPLIAGYLLAGVAVGPFTPGFVADAELAPQLAEIGVILLMFGVGIHFSVADLIAVRRTAVPGAVGQVALGTALGVGLASWWGWGFGAGIVLGLALSIASTVVLVRTLTERGILDAASGQAAMGWLVVQDLIVVIALVLVPTLAEPLGGVAPDGAGGGVLGTLVVTLGKVALFVVLMLVLGVRAIPWLLEQVERTGSRELFILGTLAVALGIAYGAAELFGASFALGAFLAGVVANESKVSQRAAEQALPLQDAFAVLFFVSVGMLIDPAFLLDDWGRLLAVAAVVIGGNAVVAFLLLRGLGAEIGVGLTVAAGLAQIGEFSFILADVGVGLDLLPDEGRNLILAAALLSITLNPLLFRLIGPLDALLRGAGAGERTRIEPA